MTYIPEPSEAQSWKLAERMFWYRLSAWRSEAGIGGTPSARIVSGTGIVGAVDWARAGTHAARNSVSQHQHDRTDHGGSSIGSSVRSVADDHNISIMNSPP